MTLYRDILDLPVALAEYEAELVKNESLRETVSQQLVCAFKGADLAQLIVANYTLAQQEINLKVTCKSLSMRIQDIKDFMTTPKYESELREAQARARLACEAQEALAILKAGHAGSAVLTNMGVLPRSPAAASMDADLLMESKLKPGHWWINLYSDQLLCVEAADLIFIDQ